MYKKIINYSGRNSINIIAPSILPFAEKPFGELKVL